MTGLTRGLLLGGLHIAAVLSLGGKLLIDRTTSPRVWARAMPVDPDLPIRGRYVSLRIEAQAEGVIWAGGWQSATFSVEGGKLVARSATGTSGQKVTLTRPAGQWTAIITEPMAFFVPEHVQDPSFRKAGEELWVEVAVPKNGPPRPIRLGVKKDGVLKPVALD